MSLDNVLLDSITIDWFRQNIPDFETKPFLLLIGFQTAW
jgi:hypothetical protein